MNFVKPNIKISIVITVIIFLQKIYRHPNDFAFIFNEGLFTFIVGIIGMAMLFGGVLTAVVLALAALQTIIKKIKKTKIYNEYGYYILGFIFLSIISYILTP